MVEAGSCGAYRCSANKAFGFFDPDGRFLKKTGSPVGGRKNGAFYAVFKAFFADFFDKFLSI